MRIKASVKHDIFMKVIIMQFLKAHGRLISNILVVLLVILAIISKVQNNETDSFIHDNDVYIFAGAVIGFLILRTMQRFRKR